MKAYVTNTVSQLRRKTALTQEELAKAVGVSRQTIIAIEKGTYTPSLLLGFTIAGFFKKNVQEVFTYHYEK